jgi:hypothetical protein
LANSLTIESQSLDLNFLRVLGALGGSNFFVFCFVFLGGLGVLAVN